MANDDDDSCDACGRLGTFPEGYCPLCASRIPTCSICGKKVTGEIGILAIGVPGVTHESCAIEREVRR